MPAKKKSVRRTRNGRSGSVRFSTYVFKVLKQVHPELAITSKAMKIMDDFMKDIFNRLTEEAAGLVKVCRKSTLTSQDFQTATRLILPGELAHHAVNEATKAVANFMGSKAADRDMMLPRMNRDVSTESRPAAREATEPEENEVEASIEEGEAGDQMIRIELESPSHSGDCTDDEVDLSAECPDSSTLNNKETDECETATEASEQEASPSRKRKEVMEHNDVAKKRKSDEYCLEPPALQAIPNITVTECSTADTTDKTISSREEPTEDPRPIINVPEIKATEQSPEIVLSEISISQKIVEETPIPQLVQASTISKNDQETDTVINVLICQDAMDSGIHETEEDSSRLQQTPNICEKKECNPTEGVDQSPQSVSCNDSGTSLGVFDGENSSVLDESSSSVALESSKSSDLSPSPCISERVSISRADSETTLIYAKTFFSPEK